jgi:hypothetical protein
VAQTAKLAPTSASPWPIRHVVSANGQVTVPSWPLGAMGWRFGHVAGRIGPKLADSAMRRRFRPRTQPDSLPRS